ncbi:MAG TPA: 16S rRNA (guanine(966)-N(2))-methyltransferase RsmD [Actinomycetota bacterium]|nr:16S rRNA (guanine(966)-N(2))-methyltransferase RsmD [Actinomycetota bacterium]
MRVIAGSAKGVRLARVPAGTRPLSDMAREGLFASLAGLVDGARSLDLYAGTGAMGIEALSRGAERATFVDRSAAAVAAVRENLRLTGFEAAGTTVRAAVERWVSGAPAQQGVFDLVLCDPPYDLGGTALSAVLASLDAGWLAPEGWTVVVTRGHRSSPVEVPVHWAVRRQLRYGDSLLTQYREERWA